MPQERKSDQKRRLTGTEDIGRRSKNHSAQGSDARGETTHLVSAFPVRASRRRSTRRRNCIYFKLTGFHVALELVEW